MLVRGYTGLCTVRVVMQTLASMQLRQKAVRASYARIRSGLCSITARQLQL